MGCVVQCNSVGKYLTVDILTSVSVIDAIAVQVEAMVDLPKKFFNLDEMTRGWAAPVKRRTDSPTSTSRSRRPFAPFRTR
jgi:hypothetical protein